MPDRWIDNLARIKDGQGLHWRDRLAIAGELIEAFQTGHLVECGPPVRDLLLALVADEKWEVRKAIANGLSLVTGEAFDDLAPRLMSDQNGFVKNAAERSYSLRRDRLKEAQRQDSAEKHQVARLQRIREKYGDEGVREVIDASDGRFDVLAGSMAHDMRSILTHLRPAAKAMLVGCEDGTDSDPRKKADRVVQGLDILERCVTDMERYTRPLPAERHPEDLAEVLTVACEMARKNIEELGYDPRMVAIMQRVPDGLRVRVARHLMILALVNLVTNAYEAFMERHKGLRQGEVFIEATSVGDDAVEITIRDTGMGMSKDNLVELSARIPRRRNKAKRKSTGYGVPIAHRYIEAHGGTIAFTSEEDKGTTVCVTLPRK